MKKLILTMTLFLMATAASAQHPSSPNKAGNEKAVKVTISKKGFIPSQIAAQKGENLVLLVTRTTDKTCMTELKNQNGKGETKLPLNKEVRYQVGPLKKSGEIKLLCGMGMKAGVVKVM